MRNLVVPLLFVVIAATGCREDVLMIVGTERPFSLYGVLNPAADTQYVHVFEVEATLTTGSSEPLDAHFTSRNLRTGETRVWSDSVSCNQKNVCIHVFWSPFRVLYGHEYRLQVEKADGRKSHVDVAVPPMAIPAVGPTLYSGEIVLPLMLRQPIPRLNRVEVTFEARTVLGMDTSSGLFDFYDVIIKMPYQDRSVRAGNEWMIQVSLTDAYSKVFDRLARVFHPSTLRHYGIELLLITVDVIAASEDWDPPGGVFETATLVHPEVMTNVKNGFGFVGAGYRIHYQWRPEAGDLEAAGFRRPGELGPEP
jgi:hypothetical protein